MSGPRMFHGTDGLSLIEWRGDFILWHRGKDRFGVIAAFARPTGYAPAPEGPHVLPGGGRLCHLDGARLLVTTTDPGRPREWVVLRDFDTWGS